MKRYTLSIINLLLISTYLLLSIEANAENQNQGHFGGDMNKKGHIAE